MYIRKPSIDQKAAYLGINPLYGFIKINGHSCIVEYLGEGKDEPNYEVLAPSGMHFVPDGITSMLGSTLAELGDRLSASMLASLGGYDDEQA